MPKLLVYGLLIAVAAVLSFIILNGRSTARGVGPRGLAPCPDSPNCVSTQADPGDALHYMEPIPWSGSAVEAQEELVSIVSAMPRSRIATAEAGYLHVVFASRLWRFRDDVEFHVDEAAGLIQFRSASRMGYSDIGVNRQRMQEITAQFTQ